MFIEVYTDGSCDQFDNGGYAAIIRFSDDKEFQISGGAFNTTSTQMELTAVLSAISYLDTHYPNTKAKIHSDYLTIPENLSSGLSIEEMQISSDKDKPLWEDICSLINGRKNFTFEWIKSHSGHPDNDRADKLAQLARKRYLLSQKPKCFVYYHSLSKKVGSKAFYVNQTVSMMIKQESNKMKTHVEDIGICIEGKDLIELRGFERALVYAIDTIKDVKNKKVIIFCNAKHIILTLKNIKRKRYILGDDYVSCLWKNIIFLMDNNDIEVYTAGRSKLDFFEIAVDEHINNQEKVRGMLLVA